MNDFMMLRLRGARFANEVVNRVTSAQDSSDATKPFY